MHGTGLGLPFARRVCRCSAATCALASEPGEGSTFTLALPATGPAAPPRRGAGDEPACSVLVCDDTAGQAVRHLAAGCAATGTTSWRPRPAGEALDPGRPGAGRPGRARRAPARHERLRGLRPDQGRPAHGVDAGGAHLGRRGGARGPDRRARRGADAYLVDPIEPEEMLATVRSLLRSCGGPAQRRAARRTPGPAVGGEPADQRRR